MEAVNTGSVFKLNACMHDVEPRIEHAVDIADKVFTLREFRVFHFYVRRQ